MKPFLLLATRPEDEAADNEYACFLRHTGLAPDELVRVRLEQAPMPPIDLDDYSGIFVGGSPFTGSVPRAHKSDTQLRVETELGRLLDVVVEADFPFFGACYGVGTLGRHQGGVVDGTYSETIGPIEVTLTAEGAADPVLEGLPERFEAYVGHKESCTMLPASAVLLASGEACPVQMFRVRRNLYGTQFHPEADAESMLTRVRIYRDAGYFDPDEQAVVEASVRSGNVGAVHRILANFVRLHAR